jgi:hypothetical protein
LIIYIIVRCIEVGSLRVGVAYAGDFCLLEKRLIPL